MVLLTVLLNATLAWAEGTTFSGGDGSAKSPYIIATTADWNQLSSDVAAGNSYNGKFFLLDDDISVTTMVGTGTNGNNAKSFSGYFDGQGHTLTFNYTATNDVATAPFCFVKNASISNLHVNGTINTSYRHVAGLVGRAYGSTFIKGCRVSTVIKSSVEGDATHGGLVVMKPDWATAHLSIDACVFDGKILSTGASASTYCGGFVGYTSFGSLTIENSIYAPAAPTDGETAVSSEATFYRCSTKNAGTITLTNCYYTQPLGTPQGKQAHSITIPEGTGITIIPTGNSLEYIASGITVHSDNAALEYNGVTYAGKDDEVSLFFVHNFVGCILRYYVGGNMLPGNDTDGYTLQMPDEDVIVNMSMTTPALVQLPGSGTVEDPYEIRNNEVWVYFVSVINSGTGDYATAHYKLTDDITVNTMMGTENNRFKGFFDGNGKTLTVNYDTNEDYCAPFRYTDNALIHDLTVAGTIKTSKKHAAGFVANTINDTEITNCRSSVTISSSIKGDGSHGGFVAHNLSGYLSIEGCTFDGRMQGSNTNNCGGFVGWNDADNDGMVTIGNSLFAPKGTELVIEKTFARSSSESYVVLTNCYCTADYNNNQQTRIYSINAANDVSMTNRYNGNDVKTYGVSGTEFYDAGLKYDGVLYAPRGGQLTLSLTYTGTPPTGSTFSTFVTTSGTLSGNATDGYRLTMSDADATISASYYNESEAWSGEGDGQSPATPYIIDNLARWKEFIDNISVGKGNFANAYYQLGANITVTTMVGSDGYKFRGHFDGNGNTLTLSYGTSTEPFDENYCAPFRYIDGADIHDLNVSGTIFTKGQFAAGIAGSAIGNNTITNCLVSVDINSEVNGDGTHGGLVAVIRNGVTTITNSVFNGSMTGSLTNNCGGFVGWTETNNEAYLSLINCLFTPSLLTVSADGWGTFTRCRQINTKKITFTDSYYTYALGSAQGEVAYTSDPSEYNIPFDEKTICGIKFYVAKTLVRDVTCTPINSMSATIRWTGSEDCTYQLRYRIKNDPAIYLADFEDGWPTDWNTIDANYDGMNWFYYNYVDEKIAHSGKGCVISESFNFDVGPIEPDNWLISPQLDLGGTLKVWMIGNEYTDYKEHFAIYLSTTGTNKEDFTITLIPETETINDYKEYTANLSSYSGQKGYIAIRHFNCRSEFKLLLDDFGIYGENETPWNTIDNPDPTGTVIDDLKPNTLYEYEVYYTNDGIHFYTSSVSMTTPHDDLIPTKLVASNVTSNTATISWAGYADSYNLRYRNFTGEKAIVTLCVPQQVWFDDSGYQMLLDDGHDTYGSLIPEEGSLIPYGQSPTPELYARFHYKIPENADADLSTTYIVDGIKTKTETIEIPAGVYDWCIVNPIPNQCLWIVSGDVGNIEGRMDDFIFEAGKHYTFTIIRKEDTNDGVDMTVEDISQNDSSSEWTTVEGIKGTSCNLSGLNASRMYFVQVQSVRRRKSNWASTTFTTTDATSIGLVDDGDNRATIASNDGQERNVTLVGRTLYKDGDWNTLCLPFNVSSTQIDNTGNPLHGATIMELDVAGTYDTGKQTGYDAETRKLYLNFKDAASITAGTPYIIKWDKASDYVDDDAHNIVNPVFTGVTISNTANDVVSADEKVSFKGTYAYQSFTRHNNSVLFLGAANILYYPSDGACIGAQRAYFQLSDLDAFVKDFNLNFGDDEATDAIAPLTNGSVAGKTSWYDLSGRKLNGEPTSKGIYINNGKKKYVK